MKLTNYNDLESHDLLAHIQQGNEEAFRFFYNQYRPKIVHIAYQYLKSKELAQEVVQEVFLKIWVDKDKLINIESIQAWLFKITKNNVLNKLKRIAVENKAKEFFTVNSRYVDNETENSLYDREYSVLLKNVVHSLPEQQRKVFEFARYEKMSYEKIANEMQLSPLTVKTHMARALRSIRSKMNDYGVNIPIIIFYLKYFF